MGFFDKIISKFTKKSSTPNLKSMDFNQRDKVLKIGQTDVDGLTKVSNGVYSNLNNEGQKKRSNELYGYTTPEFPNDLRKTQMATPSLMPSEMKNVSIGKTLTPKVLGIGETKKQEMVPSDFYDAAEKYGAAMGVPKEIILANSRWEHRNNPGWNEGKYVDNVWWNAEKNTGEESYGPGQINMRWFGPKALELGRKPGDLYITPDDAKDMWKSAEWMAKKFSKEAKVYTNKGLEPDWDAILQQYNSGEADRGKNVKNLIDCTDFVRS